MDVMIVNIEFCFCFVNSNIDAIIVNIEKGEQKLQRRVEIQEALDAKVSDWWCATA